MRSSASQSQRSPNFEQPIPNIATLSRMPLAISALLRGGRRRLPEIAREIALGVELLDAEDHAHRHADINAADIDIGEIGHHAAALGELHHAVMRWRVRRVGQVVGGVGHDASGELGEGLIDLAVAGAAIRVDADLRFRELHRAAALAAPADQREDHVALAVERRERRLPVDLCAQPWPNPATRMRSPDFACSSAWTSMTMAWAAPVSPQPAARASRTALSAMPICLAIACATRGKVQGRQKWVTEAGAVPVSARSAARTGGTILR